MEHTVFLVCKETEHQKLTSAYIRKVQIALLLIIYLIIYKPLFFYLKTVVRVKPPCSLSRYSVLEDCCVVVVVVVW